jgi:hypothetical protein
MSMSMMNDQTLNETIIINHLSVAHQRVLHCGLQRLVISVSFASILVLA